MLEDLIRSVEVRTGFKLLEKAIPDISSIWEESLQYKINTTIERETKIIEQAINKAYKADGIAEAKFVIGMVKAFRLGNSTQYWLRQDFWNDAYTASMRCIHGYADKDQKKSISDAYKEGMTL